MADWLTLLPALVAIAVVLWRKEVILALLLSLCTSELLIFLQNGQSFGAGLLAYMRYSGGVSATVAMLVNKGIARNGRQAGLLTFFISSVTFIESNLSSLTAGISSRGLFDKFKMSRARLAYIIDSTSAPICILILLNGWGAYILGLLSTYDLPQRRYARFYAADR